jgi:hypothetical protein
MVGLNIPLRFIFKPSYSPHCININVGSNPAEKMKSYLIVWTSDKMLRAYNALDFVKNNGDNLHQLRRLTNFIDYRQYKGFGREHLTSHPFYPIGQGGQFEELQENERWDNLSARRKLADFEYSENQDEFSFKNLTDAKEVFRLIETKSDYEIIEISDEEEIDTKTLGFDIGTWWTSYSLIADTFITPMWHPPDFNAFDEILRKGQRLNKFCLFDNHEDANDFLKEYLSKAWGEKEMTQGQFKIYKISSV